ncbi:hypothetical protein AOLI_G00057950 [Acnodon oligacanthus]
MASRRVFLTSQQRPESSIRNVLKWSGEQERLEARGCTLLCCMESVIGIVSGGIPENESKKELNIVYQHGSHIQPVDTSGCVSRSTSCLWPSRAGRLLPWGGPEGFISCFGQSGRRAIRNMSPQRCAESSPDLKAQLGKSAREHPPPLSLRPSSSSTKNANKCHCSGTCR